MDKEDIPRACVLVAVVFFCMAVAVQLHQALVWGHLWDWDQIHHETFSTALGFGTVVMLGWGLVFWRANRNGIGRSHNSHVA